MDTQRAIIGAAIDLHRGVGPGHREAVYERFLAHALRQAGHLVETQVRLPLEYAGLRIEHALRADLMVDRNVLVEVKSVEYVLPVFRAQVISYLRVTGVPLGLLLNFNAPRMVDGCERFVHPSFLAHEP